MAAKEKPDDTACASWKGGTLTIRGLMPRVNLAQVTAAGEPMYPEMRKSILEELVNRELASLEAEARGYPERPDVAADVRGAQDDLVEAKLYSEYVMKGVEPDDASIAAYYEAHHAEYMEEEVYAIAQILVATPEKVKEVQDKLATEPFDKLAEAYSDDPSGAQGGYMGTAHKSELTGDLAPIAGLSAGQVSAPIQNAAGYHLAKVLRIDPPRQRTLDEVKDEVRKKVLEEKRAAALARWLKPLKDAAHIEINDPGIKAFVSAQRAALLQEDAERAGEDQAKGRCHDGAKRRARRAEGAGGGGGEGQG